MAADARNKNRADISLISCGKRPEHLVTVKRVDILVHYNYLLQFRKGGKGRQSGLALATFIGWRTFFKLHDSQQLSTPRGVGIHLKKGRVEGRLQSP